MSSFLKIKGNSMDILFLRARNEEYEHVELACVGYPAILRFNNSKFAASGSSTRPSLVSVDLLT